MVHGQTEINMLGFDPRRYGEWSAGRYALEKSIDEYQQMYQVAWPGEYREDGRPVKTTPIHDKLAAAGAVFAENFGWERPKWFAPPGVEERYSFRRTNWFEPVAEECRAVRERVGVLDLSAFAKYDVTGRDAAAFLDRLCANRVPRRRGGVVLAHMLGEPGGIECEATISRLGDERFFVLSGATAELHDLDWMAWHIGDGEEVEIANRTADYACLVLTGPRSRDVLGALTSAGLGNEAFPWMSAREIEVAGVPVRALRVSYVGELGWELHHPMEGMEALYDALMDAGAAHGIVNFGLYAMNAMRMEKGYKGWGAELTTEVTPVEAGLERFVKLDKDFIGAGVVKARQERDAGIRLVYCTVDAADADAMGNEPVLRRGARHRHHHQRGLRTHRAPLARLRLRGERLRRTRHHLRRRDPRRAPSRHRAGGAALRSEERTAAGLSSGDVGTRGRLPPGSRVRESQPQCGFPPGLPSAARFLVSC